MVYAAIAIFAMNVSLEAIVMSFLAFMTGIGGAFGLQSKRQRDLIDVTERLYKKQGEEFEAYKVKTDTEISRLQGQVELFQGTFLRELASGVSDAIVRMAKEKLNAMDLEGDK